MLRANEQTGDVYGFIGEGGYVSFENIENKNGEAVLLVKGNEEIKKREFLFGQEEVTFLFTKEDIDKIGEGEHKYFLYTIDKNGNKNTLIPDNSKNVYPLFKIEPQE